MVAPKVNTADIHVDLIFFRTVNIATIHKALPSGGAFLCLDGLNRIGNCFSGKEKVFQEFLEIPSALCGDPTGLEPVLPA
jgi:hypothetical protein